MSDTKNYFNNGYALFIGIAYDHWRKKKVKPLSALNDTEKLKAHFLDPEKAAYNPKNVKRLSEEEATVQGILDALDELIEQVNNDSNATVILYYAGHGKANKEGTFLIPYDFDLDKYKKEKTYTSNHVVPSTVFASKVAAIKAKKLLVILDCCHAEDMVTGVVKVRDLEEGEEEELFLDQFTDDLNQAFSNLTNVTTRSGLNKQQINELDKGRGRIILTSCRASERSKDNGIHGLFTSVLLDCLNGLGNLNQDGWVRATDMIYYVPREVEIRASNEDGSDCRQHPVLKRIESLEGDFRICAYEKGRNRELNNEQDSKKGTIKGLEQLLNCTLIQHYSIESVYQNAKSYLLNEKDEIIGLNLWGCNLTDLSFLKGFKQLEALDISQNKIKQISVLEQLKQLKSLKLRNNQVKDISPLEELEYLQSLDLSFNEIPNIRYLSKLEKLSDLDLRGNKVYDISPLENLSTLQELILSQNHITDIQKLSKLSKLHTLYIDNNNIQDITALAYLTELETLIIRSNPIKTIDSLKSLKQLKFLSIGSISFLDMSVLTNFTQLTILDVAATGLDNITFLNKLSQLETLDLRNNKIKTLPANFLQQLPRLKVLKLYGNPLADIPREIIGKDNLNKDCLVDLKDYLKKHGKMAQSTPSSDGISKPVKIFLVYNPKDEKYAEELELHLYPYIEKKEISLFNSNTGTPEGENKADFIRNQLAIAPIVLLFASRNMNRKNTVEIVSQVRAYIGQKRIIPIRVTDFNLKETAFGSIQGLPLNGLPIDKQPNFDTAMVETANGVMNAVNRLLNKT